MSPEPPARALAATVERAYKVFAPYTLDGSIEVCRCGVCVDPETERQLIATAVRALPREVLTQYTHSAHAWSERVSRELRHFLPRYFELVAAGEDPCFYGCCLDRMGEVTYRRDWPAAEAHAVDAFFVALLRARLDEVPEPLASGESPAGETDEAEDVLVLAARAGGEVAPLLGAWDETPGRGCDLHLARLVLSTDWTRQRLSRSEWLDERRPAVRAEMMHVLVWLARDRTRSRLEAAFLAEAVPGAAEVFSQAEGLLTSARAGTPSP